MEMRYFWLLDGEAQKYSKFHYQPGQENLGDYYTKALTGKDIQRAILFYVHDKISPIYLVQALMPSTWRGCVENIGNPTYIRSPYQLYLEFNPK